MPNSRGSSFLRWVLIADATTCVGAGLLMLLGAGFLEGALGVPAAILKYSGISLLPFAAFLIFLARREHLHRPSIWAVIVCNALWTLDSFLLLVSGWIEPTTLGIVFVVAQALAVAAFAEAEYFGLRRSPVTAA